MEILCYFSTTFLKAQIHTKYDSNSIRVDIWISEIEPKPKSKVDYSGGPYTMEKVLMGTEGSQV